MFSSASLNRAETSLSNQDCNHPTWGFFGHKKINELAVYTLPAPLFEFYKYHLDYMIDHSVDPDKRRYGVVGEAECHYIDMDRYIDAEHPNHGRNQKRSKFDERFILLDLQSAKHCKNLAKLIRNLGTEFYEL